MHLSFLLLYFDLHKKRATMTHTKGEWVLGLYPQKNYPHRVVMTNDGVAIAEVIEKPDIKEMDSNAKLIAAAPDMLKALENINNEVVKSCNIGNDPLLMNLFRASQDAIQAINKAT